MSVIVVYPYNIVNSSVLLRLLLLPRAIRFMWHVIEFPSAHTLVRTSSRTDTHLIIKSVNNNIIVSINLFFIRVILTDDNDNNNNSVAFHSHSYPIGAWAPTQKFCALFILFLLFVVCLFVVVICFACVCILTRVCVCVIKSSILTTCTVLRLN